MSAKRIMVVEDEAIVALDLQSKLEDKGYEVPAILATGEDAIKRAGELLPDLILMDINLAGQLDGTQAAEQIHKQYDIPVVYLTAFSDEKTLERAKGAAPFGYMLKPFEEKKLYATVEIALYKHQSDREKERLEAQLSQSRKMEAIGRLTAGMAYHFTNILQGIQGNLDLAMLNASDGLRPFLDAADYDTQRAAQALKQLLAFYQRENLPHASVDVHSIISDVADTCRNVFARNQRRMVELQVESSDDPVAVLGDSNQLRQSLSNLCINARDALESLPTDDPRAARIVLASHVVELQTLPASAHAHATPGSYVQLSVSDNGIGMDDEAKEHLFEPFYSNVDIEHGKGLSLAATYSIVSEHQGWIECDSTPGEGTTISIFLPVQTDQEPTSVRALSSPEIITSDDAIFDTDRLRGTEKILVIADVDRGRRVLSAMLEHHGYDVLVGLDIRDGLNLFEMARNDVSLVLLDLSQTNNSAREILDQILALDPDAHILATTGYTQDSTPWLGAQAVLNKPFKTHHLLRTVRSIIDGKTNS